MLSVSLSHDYGRFRLDAEFDAPPGITAIVGASGAGKSSIVNAISGMLTPQRGRIVAGDRVLLDTSRRRNVPPHRRKVAQVFQDGRLFPHLSVRDNLLYGWRRAGTRAPDDEIAALIDRLGLKHLLDAKPRTLSGGEGQRVALGRALLAQPDVLLMDEPMAALDSDRKQEILPHFEALRDRQTQPILYVTHALSEVARLADTVVVMDRGRVIDCGSVNDVLPRLTPPSNDGQGAAFIIPARVDAHDEHYRLTRYAFKGGTIEGPLCNGPVGSAVRLRVRPADVLIGLKPPEELSALNVVPATVRGIQPAEGGEVLVRLETNGLFLLAAVTRKTVERLGLTDGRPVYAIIKAVNILA